MVTRGRNQEQLGSPSLGTTDAPSSLSGPRGFLVQLSGTPTQPSTTPTQHPRDETGESRRVQWHRAVGDMTPNPPTLDSGAPGCVSAAAQDLEPHRKILIGEVIWGEDTLSPQTWVPRAWCVWLKLQKAEPLLRSVATLCNGCELPT